MADNPIYRRAWIPDPHGTLDCRHCGRSSATGTSPIVRLRRTTLWRGDEALKKTTKALCATPRKLVMFRWPESRWVPRVGGVYQLEDTNERFKVRVVARTPEGFDVAALILDDPNRLLPANVGEYQEEPILDRILSDGTEPEPEAVSAEVEAQYGRDAAEKIAMKAARVDALHAEAEQLRRDAPEVGRELWQAQSRINAARLKLNHKRGSLDTAA